MQYTQESGRPWLPSTAIVQASTAYTFLRLPNSELPLWAAFPTRWGAPSVCYNLHGSCNLQVHSVDNWSAAGIFNKMGIICAFQPSVQAGPTARHINLVLISSTPSGTSPVVNGRLLSLAGAPAKQPAADMPARTQAADFSSCLSECRVQSPCMESRDAIPSTCRTLQPAMVKVAPSGFDTELHN